SRNHDPSFRPAFLHHVRRALRANGIFRLVPPSLLAHVLVDASAETFRENLIRFVERNRGHKIRRKALAEAQSTRSRGISPRLCASARALFFWGLWVAGELALRSWRSWRNE